MIAVTVYYVVAALVGAFSLLLVAEAVAVSRSFKWTVRGRRVLVLAGLVVGVLAALLLAHVYVDCDLRAGATSGCRVLWL